MAVERSYSMEKNSNHIINILVSEQKPFVIIEPTLEIRGLDVLIIENFAQKHNLNINYILGNLSINNFFANEASFNELSTQIDLKYGNFKYFFQFDFKKMDFNLVNEKRIFTTF